MKINRYQRFADGNPPRSSIERGHRPLSIDTLVGDTAGSSPTLAAALFGNSAGFDFSRLTQAIVPTPATLSDSPSVALHDGVVGVVRQALDAPLGAEDPMPYLLHDRILDSEIGAPVLAQPSSPAPVVAAGPLSDLNERAPSMPANTLATPLTADDPMPSQSPGRIPDLGFLQNLPALAWVPQPGFAQPETVIRPSNSAVIPTIGEPAAVIEERTVARSDLIHELTPAVVADATVPLSLLFAHEDAGAVVASDLFITDPTPLPDLDGLQFAAVLPDPIVDPGPLV